MSQNIIAEFGTIKLSLYRYPKGQHDKSLQAWDSADELLASHCLESQLKDKTIWVFNDAFGALSCFFLKQEANVVSFSDSYLSEQAQHQNLIENGIDNHNFSFVNSTSESCQIPDMVIIKIPRTLNFLQHQLYQVRQHVNASTQIIAAAKAKDIHSSTLALFEKYIGKTSTSLAKKKSRLIFCQFQDRSVVKPPHKCWQIDSPTSVAGYHICNMANVFSQERLDIGGRFLMENLPHNMDNLSICDLGCGNGVIGITALAQSSPKKMLFVDESYMAIATAKLNVQKNRLEQLEICQFSINNCLQGIKSNSIDLVLCNPPFHQQNSLTEHIAKQMFNDAKKALRKGGELRIVANSHLPYPAILKRLFGRYQKIASNKKFVILSVTK